MPRPKKYHTDAERQEGRRQKERERKRRSRGTAQADGTVEENATDETAPVTLPTATIEPPMQEETPQASPGVTANASSPSQPTTQWNFVEDSSVHHPSINEASTNLASNPGQRDDPDIEDLAAQLDTITLQAHSAQSSSSYPTCRNHQEDSDTRLSHFDEDYAVLESSSPEHDPDVHQVQYDENAPTAVTDDIGTEEALETGTEVPSGETEDSLEELLDMGAKWVLECLKMSRRCPATTHLQACQTSEESTGCEAEEHESLTEVITRYLKHLPVVAHDLPFSECGDQLSPENWSRAMSGCSLDGSQTPRRLYWQRDQPDMKQKWPLCEAYDLDSVVGFPTSPAVARGGLKFIPCPLRTSNLTDNLKLNHRCTYQDPEGKTRRRTVPVHEIPHVHLGRFLALDDISLFLFFPSLYSPGRQTNFLTREQLGDLYSNVLIPACRVAVGSARAQHYPLNYRAAELNSLARGAEASRGSSSSVPQSRSQMLSYPILGHQLQPWWEAVASRGHLLTNDNLKDMKLLINGKNLKCICWKYGISALAPTLERFQRQHFDMQHWPETLAWFDLGQEINTMSSEEAEEHERSDHEDIPIRHAESPQTVLWRACCLNNQLKLPMQDQTLNKHWINTYHFGLSSDVQAKTITPAKSSSFGHAGLLYSQFYNSIKEVHDAAKHYPFQGKHLESLTQDDELNRAIEKAGRGTHQDPNTLAHSYLHNKVRLLGAWSAAAPVRYGVRQEHRLRYPLFRRLLTLATHAPESSRDHITHASLDQQPFFVVPNRVLQRFLQYSCNRFLYGLEWVRAHADPKCCSQQETQLMLIFLRFVSYAAGSQMLNSAQWLWLDQWRRQMDQSDEARQGLDFKKSLQERGLAWLPSKKFNWIRIQMTQELCDTIPLHPPHIIEVFRRRWQEVKAVVRLSKGSDDLRWLLKQHHHRAPLRVPRSILWYAFELLIVQFRCDVFATIKGDLIPAKQASALKGEVPLCWSGLRHVLTGDELPHLITGNRIRHKKADCFARYFWTNDGGLGDRGGWKNLPYRILFQKVCQTWTDWYGATVTAALINSFLRAFLTSNWLLPVPDQYTFSTRTKAGVRNCSSKVDVEEHFFTQPWDFQRACKPTQILHGRPTLQDRLMMELDDVLKEAEAGDVVDCVSSGKAVQG
ncbi:MAG: hypothetical protein M1816_005092 [Peltula sp. TS41687]|nr:MAG: hypothetical protein M1816_005092 [Peltula sp. TS41687]